MNHVTRTFPVVLTACLNGMPGTTSSAALIDASACDTATPEPTVDGCVTATLSCGDVVRGHTLGEPARYTTAFYEANHCTPATTRHDAGGERVYRLDLPEGDWRAHVRLETPCADLDLAALRWSGETCPEPRHQLTRCEMSTRTGTATDEVELSSRGPSRWYLVVDGKDDADGAFALQVRCTPGL